ncbi:MAG: sn-glycerol-3-phosphate ABC transporter ATP-binding protein UgpC [Verrucomicrobiota bacterium]
MANVILRNLTKIYPGDHKNAAFEAVKGIDLEIGDGEFMVLVGPSGCAKSTTLRMVAGLEEVTEGEVLIDGGLMNDVPPKDRDIAMVFQNYALYPHMNVYENMAFGLKLRRIASNEIRRRVDEAAEVLGLVDLLERRPKALSGGQRQRVALGRAIVRQPKVFLFDEPLSNLDAKMRVSMRTEIARLHKRLGTTMIYVTHDQTEAMTLGDRITVMESGEIMQVDAPLRVYERPANRFVAGFIGSPPMNFLEGTLESGAEGSRIVLRGSGEALSLTGVAGISGGTADCLGIRPEHVGVSTSGGAGRIRASVVLSEPMGAETIVHMQLPGGVSLVARVDGALDPDTGSEVFVTIDVGKVYFFEAGGRGEVIGDG